MTDHPSIMIRIAIGKAIGFVIGLAGFVILPFLVPDVGWQLRWGILLWYTTLGAIVGVLGIFTRHPGTYVSDALVGTCADYRRMDEFRADVFRLRTDGSGACRDVWCGKSAEYARSGLS